MVASSPGGGELGDGGAGFRSTINAKAKHCFEGTDLGDLPDLSSKPVPSREHARVNGDVVFGG